MLTLCSGDLFSTSLPAIGHGVNTVGDMSGGVARVIRDKFPKVYEVYKDFCIQEALQPGDALGVVDPDSGVLVYNLASQRLPGADAKLDLISESFRKTLEELKAARIPGIALPRIGCGIGGLEWIDVLTSLSEISKEYPEVEVEIWSL